MTIAVSLQAGIVLQERYQIGRAIGHGGMGAVYEVIDQRLNARCALKQILRVTPALREAFEHEARLLANLRHAALPRVTDYFSEADSDCIVMEYIAGDDLATIVTQRGAIPVEQVLDWADQLLDVLVYLHTRQPPVIHRDIKPHNIKVTERGRLILLDFGIAKGSAGVTPSTGQDVSVAAWTPHYAPPEQLLREGTDARSDIYAAGATLYHLLCSRRPVAVNERLGAIHNDRPDPLPPVHSINSQVPPALSDLIQQMMALRPVARPFSAAECRERLRVLRGEAASPLPPAATTEPSDVAVDRTAPEAHPDAAAPPRPYAVSVGEQSPAAQRASAPSPRHESESRSPRGSGQLTLQKRIHAEVRRTLDSYPGAWMVWCDPRGDWRPLLERVAGDERMGGFPLLAIDDQVIGAIGGLRARQIVRAAIERGEAFVLVVPVGPDRLGWLWAQALQAERTYTRSLRDQLLAWGWRPPHPHVSEDEIALLARQGLQQDPAAWGGGGLEPDLPLLLEVLAGGAEPAADTRYILDLTIEHCGLPSFDAQHPARWRTRALARLLVTQAYAAAPQLVGEANEWLIAAGQRPVARDLLGRWTDSLRLSKRLPQAILEADKIAALDRQFVAAAVKHAPVLSRAAEYAIFAHTCARLAQKSGKALLQALAAMQADLVQHAQSFWGDPAGRFDPAVTIPWAELLRLSHAAQRLLETAPTRAWQTPDDAVQWFTTGGWQLDVAGEEILRNLSRATPELLELIALLRNAYRARWEHTLIQWSDLWTAAGCPTPRVPTAGDWLAHLLTIPRATAIVVIDALRYDLGSQLAAMINQQEGAERATVQAARAPLPTITALGMGMALPIAETQLRAELIGTRWRLVDTASGANLSGAEERRTWLVARRIVPADGFVPLAEALRGQIPAPTRSRTRLCITDDAIDRLGHDDELELLGSGFALDRYCDLVMRLRDAGWRRVLIVTDHGFIHWSGSAEKRLAPPVPDPAYRSRRALAYPREVALPESHGLAPGGQWQVLSARGASCWSAYGGLGYFHGGAALQEWIIPCVRVAWPGQAQPVAVSIQSLPRVLSVRPRVVLQIERGSMFVEDALPRHVIVRMLHATDKTVLFRSDQTEVTPGQEQVAVALRLTPGASAAWDAPLQIEVRDALTDEVIATAESVLRARLDAW